MTFDQLSILDAIVGGGSFQAAADKLWRTQPAISIAVKKLETELGFALFTREKRGSTLTPNGAIYYRHAQRVLAEIGNMALLAKHMASGRESELGVVVDILCPMPILLRVLRDFFARQQHTRLRLFTEVLSGVPELLQNGSAVIAIAPMPRPMPVYEPMHLSTLELLPVVASDVLDTLADLPQILVSDSGKGEKQSHNVVDEALSWAVSDLSVKKQIIDMGLGWGYLPRHTVETELAAGQLLLIDTPQVGVQHLDLLAVRPAGRPVGPVAAELWEYLREEVASNI
ncbi:MAG: DNA-binding transcriptional LysR family regulator [Rhodothermales bacterium]|jgi:DNA-binding transcriptional LysR family regulator